jgi:hypothetical protein
VIKHISSVHRSGVPMTRPEKITKPDKTSIHARPHPIACMGLCNRAQLCTSAYCLPIQSPVEANAIVSSDWITAPALMYTFTLSPADSLHGRDSFATAT